MAADTVAGQTGPVEFAVLGPLEVSRSGRAMPLGGPRQRAVLALLLLEANRVVSMDRLAEDVWGGHPPEGWVTTLQTYVSHLRQALEPDRARGAAGAVLVTRGRGYLLRVGRGHLDAAVFEDGFSQGRAALEAGRYAEAAQTLRQALALWRGPLLADLADYAFTRPEAARLEELRLAALEARIDPATHAVIQSVPVGSAPSAVAVTGQDVWVTNSGDGTVSRISAAADRVVDTITVGNVPVAIASGPSGVWVARTAPLPRSTRPPASRAARCRSVPDPRESRSPRLRYGSRTRWISPCPRSTPSPAGSWTSSAWVTGQARSSRPRAPSG
jgi:hypothetical protein